MPAIECLCHSGGSPQTYPLLDGRLVEIRSGCVVDAESREVLANSSESQNFMLMLGDLTRTERQWWEEWGGHVCESASVTGMGQFGITHNKFGR